MCCNVNSVSQSAYNYRFVGLQFFQKRFNGLFTVGSGLTSAHYGKCVLCFKMKMTFPE